MASQSAAHLRMAHTASRRQAITDLGAAGLLFIAIGAAFLTVTMLAASIAPDYDFAGGAISDLGVIDQTAFLFNALLIAIGVMNIAAGYALYRWSDGRGLFAMYMVAGFGTVGAGLVPLDAGGLHSLFALLAFLFVNLEVVATARRLTGPMRVLGIAAGVVGLAFAVLMVIGDAGNPAVFGPIGHGGSERMIAYPAMLWLVAFGGHVLAGRPDAPSR